MTHDQILTVIMGLTVAVPLISLPWLIKGEKRNG